MSKNKIAACLSSKSVEWATPQAFFNKLNEEFRFDLYMGYIVGATEQRKIDVIQVRQFLIREAAYNGSMSCVDDLLIEEVCKVLEEES